MMQPPCSIHMETIWHGPKSLAHKLEAKCFGSTKPSSIECLNEQSCNSLCKDLRKSNVSKHIGFAQNLISKPPLLHIILNAYWYYCSTVNRYAKKIFCSRIPAIERSNDPLDQLMQSLKSSHVVNVKQASGRGDNDASLGTKQLSSITHPLVLDWGTFRYCKLTCHKTGISLWRAPAVKKRAPLVFRCFYIDMSFTNMVDCLTCPLQTWLNAILWCCRQMLNYISWRKWFCSLNGTVTKTRTLAQPSCQVRRLSNFKLACLIYLYSFVCSAYSFICRRLFVLCTWVYFLSFVVHAITQLIGMALTHWGRDKMAAISQTTLSNAFSWMKMLEFRYKFHWGLFLRAQLTILQHWFR